MRTLIAALTLLVLAGCSAPATATPLPPTAVPPTLVPSDTPTSPPTSTFTPVPPTVPPTPTWTPTLPVQQPPTLPPSLVPPTLETPLTPSLGLIVRGYVRLAGGEGVPGVPICRSYASYPGTVIATTGPDGSYVSAFAYIPGDEMVTVWPGKAGYTFDPPFAYWRHYASAEDRTIDFTASPASATTPPPAPCP